MTYDDLPKEILDIIFNYAFAKCEKCKLLHNFDNLTSKCRIFEYKNVFQDEYWNRDEMIAFQIICTQCIFEYSGKIIVNLRDNTYCWIKDYDISKEYK